LKATRIILVLLLTLIFTKVSLADDTSEIKSFINSWRDAQLSRQIASYRAFYSPQFQYGDIDLKTWMKEKRSQFKKDGPLSLDISEINIKIENNRADVTFLAQYKGKLISEIGQKKLKIENINDKWKIASENWQTVSGFVVTTKSETFGDQQGGKIIIKSISYEIDRNNLEKVLIDFNQFYTPAPFVLEKDRPRVVLDIKNSTDWKGPKVIPVNGQWIKKVRSHFYSDKRKLRIVLDLAPSLDYTTKQVFYKAENIYSLEIKKTSK
jgi:hypothetical protein